MEASSRAGPPVFLTFKFNINMVPVIVKLQEIFPVKNLAIDMYKSDSFSPNTDFLIGRIVSKEI